MNLKQLRALAETASCGITLNYTIDNHTAKALIRQIDAAEREAYQEGYKVAADLGGVPSLAPGAAERTDPREPPNPA